MLNPCQELRLEEPVYNKCNCIPSEGSEILRYEPDGAVSHFVQTESAMKIEYISDDYHTQKPTETLQKFYVFGNCDFFHLRDAAANSVVDPDLQDLFLFLDLPDLDLS